MPRCIAVPGVAAQAPVWKHARLDESASELRRDPEVAGLPYALKPAPGDAPASAVIETAGW